jgi:PAS domain S-box-containing protein
VLPLYKALIPSLVALVGAFATGAAVVATQQGAATQAEALFAREADALESEIRRRLQRARDGLESLRAGWAISGRLETPDLQRYLARRDFAQDYPGLRGLGINEPVRRAEVAAFEARQRAAGHPQFRVRSTTADDQLYVIRSVEPPAGNGPALGYDVGSNPIARAAVQEAVASGMATLSAPLVLQQDAERGTGYVLYLPVYRGEPRSETQRLQALALVLFASFTTRELIGDAADAVGAQLGFRVRDAQVDGPVVLATPGWHAAAQRQTRRTVLLGNRALTLEMADRLDTAQRTPGRVAPWLVGVAGALLTALLAAATWLLAAGRLQALARVAAMGEDMRRLARIVERTGSAVFTTDRDGRLTWANAGMARLAGLPGGSPVGWSAAQALAAAGVDAAALDALQAALLDGADRRLELAARREDGQPGWIELILSAEREAGVVQGWSAIALDITRRKRAEDRLAGREHLLRTIADNVPAGISYWDQDARCRFANRRMHAVLGLARDDLPGRPLAEVLAAPQQPVLQPRVQAVLQGQPQRLELVVPRPDGEVTWQVDLLPDRSGGAVQGFFLLATDVTELRRARDLALEASRAKTQFLSNMSHEIRTPMNAVLGMLALLRGSVRSARERDYARKAEGAARSLLSLLDDVLDIARIEAGRMELHPRPFSLEALLADLAVILAAAPGGQALELLYDIDPRVPDRLVGDDMRLRQILINLGGNAIKFTDTGHVLVRVRLVARDAHEATVGFEVADSGIGIANADQQRLFRDFVQADTATTRRYGGSGLGLGICRRLTGLMGSQLHLRSTPGRGSSFSFELRLPLAPADATPSAPAVPPQRVLVADDHPLARDTLGAMATGLGWEVATAADGADALRQLQQAAHDGRPCTLLLADLALPGLDGPALARQARAALGAAAPRVVLLAGRGQAPVGPVAGLVGDDPVLSKPVTPAMLREAALGALASAAVGALQAPEADDFLIGGEPPLAGLRLLVAEDNAVNQQIARELLAQQGAAVTVVDDGQQAVDRLAAGERYDAVLMDMRMPVLDGLEATRRIRALGLPAPHLPIVAMTANALDSDRAACLAAGMDDHVGKPFELEHLVAVLRRWTGLAEDASTAPDAPARLAASVPAAGDALPVLDRDGAIARMGGNAELYARALVPMRAQLAQLRGELEALPATPVGEAHGRVLHALKGMAATMGAERLRAAAAAGETAARQGDPGAPDAVAGALARVRELQALLDAPA